MIVADPVPADLAAAAVVFGALADPTRLHLVARLGDGGPASMVRLADGTPLTRQAVAKHLRVLESAGVVHSHRSGRERIWQVDAGCLDAAGAALDRAAHRWDAAIGRLRRYVEEVDQGPEGS